MSEYVKPKKHLGQHFLVDKNIARKIAGSVLRQGYSNLLEIGGGTGVLTEFLLQEEGLNFYVIDVDPESVIFLQNRFPAYKKNILDRDFLNFNPKEIFKNSYGIVGNFPYNISSQIFFRILEERDSVAEVVCMLQKEVAERLVAPPGNKTYGILSVLLQAFYDVEYLFTVGEKVFHPPPNVKSGVIRLIRNTSKNLECDEKLFFRVVKQAFSTRRKTLRNALKGFRKDVEFPNLPIFQLRAEQLTVKDFVGLTNLIEAL